MSSGSAAGALPTPVAECDSVVTQSGPRRPLVARDLRLVLPATACWIAVAVVFGAEPQRGFGVAVVLGSGAVMALAWVLLGGVSDKQRSELMTLTVICIVAGTGAGLTAARTVALEEHPAAKLAGESSSVMLTVTGFARPTSAEGIVLPVRLERIGSGVNAREVRLPTVILAHGGGWEGLPTGARVKTSVRVLESRSPGEAPALSALAPPRLSEERRSRAVAALWAAPLAVRAAFRDVADRALGQRSAELLPSLVLGDELLLPEEVRDAFEVTGLSHLQAVSGANTTFVVGAVVLVAGALGAGRRSRLVIGGIGLAAFVAVVGPDPAVIRAAGTGTIGLMALSASRTGRPLAALAAIVLAVSLMDPRMSRSIGFVLSVVATAGLIVGARPLSDLLQTRRIPGPVADTIAVCAIAQVTTAPVLLFADLAVSPWSFLANLLAAPVVPYLTAVGTLSAALSPVWGGAATALAWTCAPALWWLDYLAATFAKLPGAPEPS